MKHHDLRPKALRVMGRDYTVLWERADVLPSAVAGLTDNRALTIAIDIAQHPVEELDTLLHELFHAIWFQMSMGEHPPEEEVIVRKFAGGLTQVLQDNPQLIKYIAAIKNPERKPK